MLKINKNIYPDHDIKSINPSSVSDIFYNTIDKTWAHDARLVKNFFTLAHNENAIDDNSITYIYNSEFYRSDEFISDHKGKHILFMGCSETEGIGSQYDTVWSKIVYDELVKKHKISGYFNMGRAGFGWQKIISNFIQYKNRYGKPDYLLVLMPNIARKFIWNEKLKKWEYFQYEPEVRGKNNKKNEKTLSVKLHRESFIDFCLGWKLFEEYCKEANIKLYWTTWNQIENDNLKLANCFQNLFLMELKDFEKFIEYSRPNLKLNKYDLSRRDGHHGVLYHEYWAKKFLEQINKDI